MLIFYFTRDDAWKCLECIPLDYFRKRLKLQHRENGGFDRIRLIYGFKQLQDSFDEDTLRDTLQKVRLQKMLSWSQKGTEI